MRGWRLRRASRLRPDMRSEHRLRPLLWEFVAQVEFALCAPTEQVLRWVLRLMALEVWFDNIPMPRRVLHPLLGLFNCHDLPQGALARMTAPTTSATVPDADYERPQRTATLVGVGLAPVVGVVLFELGLGVTLVALWLLAYLAGLSLTGSN